MAPRLITDGDALLASWLEPRPNGHRLQLARWRDGTWSPPVTIVENPKLLANASDTPVVAVAGKHVLVASWPERSEGEGYDAIIGRSTDDGATWTRVGPLHRDGTATEHGFVSLAPDTRGVRAIWLDGRETVTGGATALRTAIVGTAITDDAVIDDRVCDCCSTAIANGVIAYRDRSTDETRDIAVAIGTTSRIVHGDHWTIAGCPVNGPALAAAGKTVAVAWFTSGDGIARVRAAFSSDGGATFAAPVEIDHATDRAPLGRVGIVLAGGDAIVSWVAMRGAETLVLARRISPARAGTEQVLARTQGRAVPRIALAGDHLALAWVDGGLHIKRIALDALR